jgi:hypothetical protein
MSQTTSGAATADATRASRLSPRKLAACHAFTQWIGETCVGLIPLFAFIIMHTYTAPIVQVFACPKSLKIDILTFPQCAPLTDNISQEICILTVVISGLALLSVVNLGPRKRKTPVTAWSYFLIVAAILALIAGALLYAVFGVHIDRGADTVTWWVLAIALFSSLCLALEGAILDA